MPRQARLDAPGALHQVKVSVARGRYLSYVEAGVSQGRRNDLVGGGLIRSLGRWAEGKGEREKVGYRIKGDERILGGSDFVSQMLAEAQEQFDQRYRFKSMGDDLKKVADKVAELYGMDAAEIMTKGRRMKQVEARSLLCYWAVGEWGMGLTELARVFGMTPSAVGYAVRRGKGIADEKGYSLTNGIDSAIFMEKMAACTPESSYIQRIGHSFCSAPDQLGNPPGCKTSFLRLCS
jgi:putative transposase